MDYIITLENRQPKPHSCELWSVQSHQIPENPPLNNSRLDRLRPARTLASEFPIFLMLVFHITTDVDML